MSKESGPEKHLDDPYEENEKGELEEVLRPALQVVRDIFADPVVVSFDLCYSTGLIGRPRNVSRKEIIADVPFAIAHKFMEIL